MKRVGECCSSAIRYYRHIAALLLTAESARFMGVLNPSAFRSAVFIPD